MNATKGINVMSNPWHVWLLKNLSNNQIIKHWHYDKMLRDAAKDLDKLQRIEAIIDTATKEDVVKILNEDCAPSIAPQSQMRND